MARMNFVMTLPPLKKGESCQEKYGSFGLVSNTPGFLELQGYIELDSLTDMINDVDSALRALSHAMGGKWALDLDLEQLAEARKLARKLDRKLRQLGDAYIEVLSVRPRVSK